MFEIPEFFHSVFFILTAALLLDFSFGDPEYKYHPIRVIGYLISNTENFFRNLTSHQIINGSFFWLFIVGSAYFVGLLFLWVGWFFELFIVYSCLAVGDLREKAFEIRDLLAQNNIDEARNKVGMIVGRDTRDLNEKEIVRATIETVAENIVDGIIAPLLFFAIGGAPLMLVYKTINTLDSMVGYKNDRYKDFGFFSAKIDDIANYIPARLSFFIISFSGLFIGQNFLKGIKMGIKDGQKNPSPNSGISEAIVAGLLGIQLGGTNYYFGVKSIKPIIGVQRVLLNRKHITETVYIAYFSSIVALLSILAFNYGISYD